MIQNPPPSSCVQLNPEFPCGELLATEVRQRQVKSVPHQHGALPGHFVFPLCDGSLGSNVNLRIYSNFVF